MLNAHWFMRRMAGWSTGANVSNSVYKHAYAVGDGVIYSIAGAPTSSTYTNKVYMYTIATDTWSERTSYPISPVGVCASIIDGVVYSTCGLTASTSYKNTYAHTISTNSAWSAKTSRPVAVAYSPSQVVSGGKMYAISGYIIGTGNSQYNHQYDPSTDTWATKANLPTARRYPGIAVVGGDIYVAGGYIATLSDKNECYSVSGNSWSTKTDLPTAGEVKSCAYDDNIYVLDGSNKLFHKYTILTDTFSTLSLSSEVENLQITHQGFVEFSGRIYMFGGYANANSTTINNLYIYTI